MTNHFLPPQISASLMCADLGNLAREIKKLEKAGVDYLHLDIMDGHFVPNFTFGPDIGKAARKITNLPLDIHLMAENPEDYIDIWEPREKDIISFHIEAAGEKTKSVITKIKKQKAKAALALNPETPVRKLKPFLKKIDMVLLMTVIPGFAGQKWIPKVLEKVQRLSDILQKENIVLNIQVDGNIGRHNIALLRQAGASIFVAGSASIFATPNYSQNTLKMRQWIRDNQANS